MQLKKKKKKTVVEDNKDQQVLFGELAVSSEN